MTFRLRYKARTVDLDESPFTVGRNPTCTLRIDDDALISRLHATFAVAPGGGGVTVTDHDSRNGVIVNGARIEKLQLLHPGDTIVIGVQKLTLVGAKAKRSRDQGAASKLAATGLHPVVPPEEAPPIRIDYVTIAGRTYAVVPKAEYLRMRKMLATGGEPSLRAKRAAASVRAKKHRKK